MKLLVVNSNWNVNVNESLMNNSEHEYTSIFRLNRCWFCRRIDALVSVEPEQMEFVDPGPIHLMHNISCLWIYRLWNNSCILLLWTLKGFLDILLHASLEFNPLMRHPCDFHFLFSYVLWERNSIYHVLYDYQCILYTSICTFITTMNLLRFNLILHSSLQGITMTSTMPVAPLYIRSYDYMNSHMHMY